SNQRACSQKRREDRAAQSSGAGHDDGREDFATVQNLSRKIGQPKYRTARRGLASAWGHLRQRLSGLYNCEGQNARNKNGGGRLAAPPSARKRGSLKRRLDAEFHRARRTESKNSGAEAGQQRQAGRFGRTIDGRAATIQCSGQDSVGSVVVVAIEQVVERSLRFYAEVLPFADWPDGPTQPQVEGEECIIADVSRRRRR